MRKMSATIHPGIELMSFHDMFCILLCLCREVIENNVLQIPTFPKKVNQCRQQGVCHSLIKILCRQGIVM